MGIVPATLLPKLSTELLQPCIALALGNWQVRLSRDGYAVRTVEEHPKTVAALFRSLGVESGLKDFDRDFVERLDTFVHKRFLGGEITLNTRARQIAALRKFLGFLWETDLTEKNLVKYLPPVRGEHREPEDVYTPTQVGLMLDGLGDGTVFDKRDTVLFKLIYGLGLRCSEACLLRICDVDFAKGQIYVRFAKGRKTVGNGLPLVGELKRMVRQYLEEVRPSLVIAKKPRGRYLEAVQNPQLPSGKELLFPSSNGSKIDSSNLLKKLKKSSHPVGVANAKIHGLRHSCATHLIQAGVDVLDVNKLLRHRDLNTTMVYVHLDKSRLVNALENFHPLLNGTMYELARSSDSILGNEKPKACAQYNQSSVLCVGKDGANDRERRKKNLSISLHERLQAYNSNTGTKVKPKVSQGTNDGAAQIRFMDGGHGAIGLPNFSEVPHPEAYRASQGITAQDVRSAGTLGHPFGHPDTDTQCNPLQNCISDRVQKHQLGQSGSP